MMPLLLTFYLSPASYFFLMHQVTYQCQLKEGYLTNVNDNQVQQRILKNTFTSLLIQLKSEQRLYVLNLQTKVRYFHLSTEPDLAITDSVQKPDRLNPVVIIEVLFQADKREFKFKQYRQIASLCEYVRIEPERYLIEHLVRQPKQEWQKAQLENETDKLDLRSIGCHLALADIYNQVII